MPSYIRPVTRAVSFMDFMADLRAACRDKSPGASSKAATSNAHRVRVEFFKISAHVFADQCLLFASGFLRLRTNSQIDEVLDFAGCSVKQLQKLHFSVKITITISLLNDCLMGAALIRPTVMRAPVGRITRRKPPSGKKPLCVNVGGFTPNQKYLRPREWLAHPPASRSRQCRGNG